MGIVRRIALFVGLVGVLALIAACDSNAPPTPTPLPPEPGPTAAPEEAGVIPARVLDRQFGTQDWMLNPAGTPFRIQTPVPNMTFKIELTNGTGKDLAAVRGVLLFRDTAGKEIERFTPRFEVMLPAGDSAVVEYPIMDNEYVKERQDLKETPTSDIVVLFKPTTLTLRDGATEVLEGTP
jgi:hypothetical protein